MNSYQKQLLFNNTTVALPEQPITRIFESLVASQPDSQALIWNNGQMSYSDLNSSANQLSRYLQQCGLKSNETVAILMEQSPDVILTLIALMKMGCPAVPIPADYPSARIKFMLEDCKASLLLSHAGLRDFAAQFGLPTVMLDKPKQRESLSDDNLPTHPELHQVALIFYTSGSTGQPKGVQVLHRGILRLIWQQTYMKLGHGDSVAQISNIAFDAATFEIWGALATGARLVVLPSELAMAPQKLVNTFQKYGITASFIPTSYFNLLANQCPNGLKNQRYVYFGGETADIESVRKIVKHGKPLHLYNIYGPTETTTFATAFLIENELPGMKQVPIGLPIVNTKLYIADEQLNLLPIGESGEILIGGPGVAAGYLNRPELSAKKFIPDIFSGSGMLYRTGDLGRFLPDGNVEFLGRLDSQVKIHGFRIELDEVENAIRQLPHVQDAIVLVKEGPRGKELAAFWVRAQPGNINLREILRKDLPGYMIPKAFVELKTLPLNANGKIDRASLANISVTFMIQPFEAPSTELEDRLLKIWRKILHQDILGVLDNFNDVGGDSLLGAQLIAEVEKVVKTEIPLSRLATHGSVRAFAEWLKESSPGTEKTTFVQLQSQGSQTPLFLFSGGGANLLYLNGLAQLFAPNRTVYGALLHGTEKKEKVSSVEKLAVEKLTELLKIWPDGPYILCGHSLGGVVALEMARLLRQKGHDVAFIGMIDTYPPGCQVEVALSKSFTYHIKQLRQRPFWRWAPYVRDILLARLARELNVDFLKKSLQVSAENVLVADKVSNNDYRPEPYIGCVTIFESQVAPQKILENRHHWEMFIPKGLERVQVPGNHLSLLESPNVEILAGEIRSRLDKLSS